jgi:predicted RecA/RadA family phage recombinase
MAQLTHANPRPFTQPVDNQQDYPMTASVIYEGSAVSDAGSPGSASGNAEQLVAGENFLGFAHETVNNSAGSAGSTTINVVTSGIAQLSVTGVTNASTGVDVYASDGNTFTTTSTSNSLIGRVVKVISGTTCSVRFWGVGMKSI